MSQEDRRGFPAAARVALGDSQLRHNLRNATGAISAARAASVAEMPDWEELREAGRALKERTLRHLDSYLEQLEANVKAAGGVVHWARDGEEAASVVGDIIAEHRASSAIKAKSLTTDEIGLNDLLAERGIAVWETDLAEFIIQLAGDTPSHVLVPAIHKNRSEIAQLFRDSFANARLPDDPVALAEAARRHLREVFLAARVGITGVNFAVAETGSIAVVESEGNGRMCLTLPEVLISIMGIEKLVPTWQDLEVFLQLLPRSSTAERMNPYTSVWTGITPGDGPNEFHLVLLDNGRTKVLRDTVGRQTLNCIRCSACLNVCPVYSRTGGHAYGSVYPGPIGAILTPQLTALEHGTSLPFASTLCGACADVCPVKIDIPQVLVHLRSKVVDRKQAAAGVPPSPISEARVMRLIAGTFASQRRYETAQRLARAAQRLLATRGPIRALVGPVRHWTTSRDLKPVASESFRQWWRRRKEKES